MIPLQNKTYSSRHQKQSSGWVRHTSSKLPSLPPPIRSGNDMTETHGTSNIKTEKHANIPQHANTPDKSSEKGTEPLAE